MAVKEFEKGNSQVTWSVVSTDHGEPQAPPTKDVASAKGVFKAHQEIINLIAEFIIEDVLLSQKEDAHE